MIVTIPDQDGFITVQELSKANKAVSKEEAEAEAEVFVAGMDMDGDHRISFDEYKSFIIKGCLEIS